MTPDHALRQAILQTDHPAAKRKSTKPRKARREKASRPFWVTFLMRGVFMVLGLLAVRVMLYTPQGEVLMSRAQNLVASVMAEHLGVQEPAPASPGAAAPEPAESTPKGAKRVRANGEAVETSANVSVLPQARVTVRRGGQSSAPTSAPMDAE